MGRKTEMLYLSSPLPALLSISSIFRSNKTVLPTSTLPGLRDTLADKTGQQAPLAWRPPCLAQSVETHHLLGSRHSHRVTQMHVCTLLQLSVRAPPAPGLWNPFSGSHHSWRGMALLGRKWGECSSDLLLREAHNAPRREQACCRTAALSQQR